MSKDRAGGLLILAICLAYTWQTLEIPAATSTHGLTASSMPWLVALLTFGCAALLIAKPGAARLAVSGRWARLFAIVLLVAAFGFVLDSLGIVIASFIFLFVAFRLMGERRILVEIAVAAAITTATIGILVLGLGVALPLWPVLT